MGHLFEGQILGGVVHGLGNALFERMHYDEAGQPLSVANAVIASIENALAPFGVIVNDYPVDPERICDLLDQAATAT